MKNEKRKVNNDNLHSAFCILHFTFFRLSFPVVAMVVLRGSVPAPASGEALSWDPGATYGTGLGGNGTWDYTSPNWWDAANDGTWSDYNDAVFGGAAGAVTIAYPGVTPNNLYFDSSGYVITGATLILGGGSVNISPGPQTGAPAAETIDSTLVAVNGLSLTGSGVLTLGGAASCPGPTAISSGTLLINATDTTSSITVGNGSTTFGALGGSGSTGASVSVAANAKNAVIAGCAGSGGLTVGGLSFAGAAGIYIANVSQYSTSAAIVVTGANGLSVPTQGGSVPIVLAGAAPSGTGTVELLQYSGSITGGNSAAFTLNTAGLTGAGVRASFTLTNPSGYIDLRYSVDHPVWTGALDGKWVTSSGTAASGTADWKSALTGGATNFVQGDSVIFNDTAGASTTVNISGANVAPSAVTFDNNTLGYTLTGAYGIAGATSLTVNGSGAVTIANSNSYSGGTTVNAGRLSATCTSALGTGPLAQNGGTVSIAAPQSIGSVSLSGGLLNIANPQALGAGTITLGGGTIGNTSGASLTLPNNPINLSGSSAFGGNALNLGTGNVSLSNSAAVCLNNGTALTVGGAMTDDGTGLTVNGRGLLALTASSGYTGPTNVNGGTLGVGNGGSGASIGATSGVNLAGNATLLFNHSDAVSFAPAIAGSGNLVQSGGTLALTTPESYSGATLVAAGVLRLGTLVNYAISGFGANTSGAAAGTITNGTCTFNTYGPYTTTPVTNNVLTLTDGAGNEARSAFFNTPVPITGGFNASFVYQATSGSGGADGITVMFQNDSRGLAALGGYGGGLGYGSQNGGTPITNSVALLLNIYSGAPGGVGATAGLNGSWLNYAPTGNVNVASGDPILVNLSYDGSNTLTVQLSDSAAGATFSQSYPVGSLAMQVGSSTAYIGFSGADGGVTSTQTISEASYAPPAPVNILPATTDLSIARGATLDLAGGSQQVDSLCGSGSVTNGADGQLAALSVSGTISTTFGGTIGDGSGQTALTVTSGSLTLSGTNSYTGGTTVSGDGTLIIANYEGLADNSSLIVGDASLFGFVTPAAAGYQIESVPSAAAPVPEPGALAIAAGLLAILAAFRSGGAGGLCKPPATRTASAPPGQSGLDNPPARGR